MSGVIMAAQLSGRMYLPGLCGYGLSFALDGFRIVFVAVTFFAWIAALTLSGEYMRHEAHRARYYIFTIVTLAATIGVFLSADFFTAFIFFEIMSFTSYTWVAQTEKAAALRAADTYLAVAVIGGLVMLMGMFLLYHMFGTLDFEELGRLMEQQSASPMLYAAGACILTGFGAKAGVFPLHIWLPKAHPVAPAPASALLSGVLTKTGIYGVIVLTVRIFAGDMKWGTLLLILGACTMFVGAVLAVFALDLKRTLACSSVSQIGFIMTGIGMCGLLYGEHALAAHGAMLHMINHSLIKLVLFLSAGVIYMNTHRLDLNVIRGFGRRKPFLAACFAVGALAIGGIPGFSGYISKTLIHESILEYGAAGWMRVLEMVFVISGGLTIAYMSKLFVTIFLEKNTDADRQSVYDVKRRYLSPLSACAIGIPAVVLAMWGFLPHRWMDRVAACGNGFFALAESGGQMQPLHYFSLENLKGAAYSVVIGVIVYVIVIRRLLAKQTPEGGRELVDRWPRWLDLEDLIYRPVLLRFLPYVGGIASRICDSLVDMTVVLLRRTIYRDTPLPREYTEGNTWTRALGRLLNLWRDLANRTWRKADPIKKDYVHQLAVRSDQIAQNNLIITRSISFGLLLFGIGFCLMLFYLVAGDLHF